jgi:hypothetical protein
LTVPTPHSSTLDMKYIWSYWPTWVGAQELVERTGRCAVEAIEQLGVAKPCCRIAVSVWPGGDVERFDSLEHFGEQITHSALKNFSRIEMVVGADGPRLTLSFAKGLPTAHETPFECSWLRRGVLVELRVPTGPNWGDASLERARVDRALARGWGESPARGVVSELTDVQKEVTRLIDKRRQPSAVMRLFAAMFTPLVALLAAKFLTDATGFPLSRNPDGSYLVAKWLGIFLLVSSLLGWFWFAPMTRWLAWRWRAVVIRDHWFVGARMRSTLTARIETLIVGLALVVILGYLGFNLGLGAK